MKKQTTQEIYITVTGLGHYHGAEPFKVGDTLLCIKEPDNCFDDEAIAVFLPTTGKVGYVANSWQTKAQGTFSAGRIHDCFAATASATIKFITNNELICLFQLSTDNVGTDMIAEDQFIVEPTAKMEG